VPLTETKDIRYQGCTKNGAAELWAVQGGPHDIVMTTDALQAAWRFAESHAKPE
jgi:hypothetical protein